MKFTSMIAGTRADFALGAALASEAV